jgi:hypothetical protein
MPFAYDSKKTLTVQDIYNNDHDTIITLETWFSDDKTKIKYKVSVNNEVNHNHRNSLFVFADNNIIYKTTYNHYDSGSVKSFPHLDGGSISGEVDYTKHSTQDSSVTFRVYIACYQWAQPGFGGLTADNTSRLSSGSVTISKKYYTNATISTPVITDLGNNSCKFTFYPGKSGTNNSVSSSEYRYDIGTGKGFTAWKTFSSTSSITEDFGILPAGTAATRTIKAEVRAAAKYNTPTNSNSVAIKQYALPYPPKAIVINKNNASSTKYVVNKPLKVSWTAAAAGNSNSPVSSYKVVFEKSVNGSFQAMTLNNTMTLTAGSTSVTPISNSYFLVTPTSFSFIPKDFGLSAKDTFRIKIWSCSSVIKGYSASAAISSSIVFQNAGIVHFKQNGSYKEGQVFMKKNNVWHEAETTCMKNSSWKVAE